MRDVQELIDDGFHDLRVLEGLHHFGPHEAMFLVRGRVLSDRVEGQAVSHNLQHRLIIAVGLQAVLESSLAVEVFLKQLFWTSEISFPMLVIVRRFLPCQGALLSSRLPLLLAPSR